MDEYEAIQARLCSNSRRDKGTIPGRMGQRLVRNINEAMPYFEKYNMGAPVVDVGCGDGWGLECFKSLAGATALYGIELVQERVDTAKGFGLTVFKGVAEDTETILKENKVPLPGSIFCSHVLEHCKDQEKAIRGIQAVANFVWILVPVEVKGTSNAAHCSPVRSLEQIRKYFDVENWLKVKEEYRVNLEPEGVLAFVKSTSKIY